VFLIHLHNLVLKCTAEEYNNLIQCKQSVVQLIQLYHDRQGYFCDTTQNAVPEVLSQNDTGQNGIPEPLFAGINITNTSLTTMFGKEHEVSILLP
jgi:hypothetical protein